MKKTNFLLGNDYPNNSHIPRLNDLWNAHITKVNSVGDLQVAGCISTNINIFQGNLIIIVTPKTTRKDIIKNWGRIAELRDKIAAYYGDFEKRELYVRQTAYRLHNDFKLGYGEIAMFLNIEILVFLCIDLEIIGSDIKAVFKLSAGQYFDDYLSSFGFSQDVIDEYKAMAIEGFEKNEYPWDVLYQPLDTSMIREAVRSFESLIKKKSVTSNKKLDHLTKFVFNEEARIYVYQLLLRTFRENSRKINNMKKKWDRVQMMILADVISNFEDYCYPVPTNMGGFDQFFP